MPRRTAGVSLFRHVWGKGDVWPEALRGKARIVIVDPPYNQGVKYADDPTEDSLTEIEYLGWASRAVCEISDLLMPGGTIWWVCPERFANAVSIRLSTFCGPRLYRIVWEETFAQYQQKTLTEDYRFIFCHYHYRLGYPVVFNPDAIRVPSKRQEMGDKRADPRGRVPGRVWRFRRLQGTSKDRVDWHPTQLPPELLSRIVRGWSNPGDLVVDAFAGSGNTGLICQKEGREFVGFDRSPTYCQKMLGRLTPIVKG
jgi:site-specific DNA-methyltransferase (adenine-specific)